MTPLSKNARVAGLLYALFSAFLVVRLGYIPDTLIVYDNAAATATNIEAHESLFRFGIVSYLLGAAGCESSGVVLDAKQYRTSGAASPRYESTRFSPEHVGFPSR